MATYGWVSAGRMAVQLVFVGHQFTLAPLHCEPDSAGEACRSNQIYLFPNCLFITFWGFAGLLSEGKGGTALNNGPCQGPHSL